MILLSHDLWEYFSHTRLMGIDFCIGFHTQVHMTYGIMTYY